MTIAEHVAELRGSPPPRGGRLTSNGRPPVDDRPAYLRQIEELLRP